MLTLSLFPGIDLLGRAFEQEGFTVVRGPDLIFGQSIEEFHLPANAVTGIICGPPCQEFSRKRRHPPTGIGIALLRQALRVIHEGQPDWALLENIPGVPDVRVQGYHTQRLNLNARECGSDQDRLRCFQFLTHDGRAIVIRRQPTSRGGSRTVLAHDPRDFTEMCRLQGLPESFDLPGWPLGFKKRAVGNGVPTEMGRAVAQAVREAATAPEAWRMTDPRLCVCGCGRLLSNWSRQANGACRQRLLTLRKLEAKGKRQFVTWPMDYTPAESRIVRVRTSRHQGQGTRDNDERE